MKNELETLDQLLKSKRPEFYEKLNAPLTKEEIKNLETKFNVALPEDFKALYGWKNGQADTCYKSFVNNCCFIPLKDLLSSAALMASLKGSDFEMNNWWNKAWLPVFGNVGGSYICYDLQGIFTGQSGQLIEYWKSDKDRNVIAPNLKSFIQKLNHYYLTTLIEKFDSYFAIESTEGFPVKYYAG